MSGMKLARLAAPVLLCVAGAAQAAAGQDDLRVVGNRADTAVAWRTAVARDISANLSAPRGVIGTPSEGAVKLLLHAGADGRIGEISVATPSGSAALDRAAVMAVSRMRTLPAAPAGVDVSLPVEAWVYFADTDGAADRIEARLRRAAARGLASGGQPIVAGLRG